MKRLNDDILIGILVASLFWVGVFVWQSSQPPHHKSAESQSCEGTKSECAKATSDERIADYTWWLAVLTGALVTVSAGQGYFLLRADKTARIAADAARVSADAAVGVARPRLLLRSITIESYEEALESWNPGPRHNLRCNFALENYGRTPAILLHSSIDFRFVEGLPKVPTYRNIKVWKEHIIYGRDTIEGLTVSLPSGELDVKFPDRHSLMLLGFFVFDDVFGKRRKTGFCYILARENDTVLRLNNPDYNYDQEIS